jgi:hypothetical protein
LYLKNKTDGQFPLASNRGWSEFGDWAETLDWKTYPTLANLWYYGWVPVAPLREHLTAVLRDSPPSEKSVRATARNLLRLVRGLRGSAVAVTNGTD